MGLRSDRTLTVLALCAVATFTLPMRTAQAQDVSEPTPTQVQSLNDGAAAAASDDFDAAIRHFKTALEGGSFNIIHLNLGRALYKAGHCEDAMRAFSEVPTSPTVASPPPDAVLAALERYRAEAMETCDGAILVRCEDRATMLAVDGAVAIPCPTTPIPTSPGVHVLTATLDGKTESAKVPVKAMESATVSFHLRAIQAPLAPTTELVPRPLASRPPNTPNVDEPRWTALTGWTVIGLGVAVLGGVVLYDQLSAQPMVTDFEEAGRTGDGAAFEALRRELFTAKAIEWSGLLLGGSLTLTGAALVVYSHLDADLPGSVTRGVSPHRPTVSWAVTW